jgi:uncharacterized repeat protein (TIGR01451 family)
LNTNRSIVSRCSYRYLAALAALCALEASAQFYEVVPLSPVAGGDASEAAVLLDDGLVGGTTWRTGPSLPRAVYWQDPASPQLLPLPQDSALREGEVLGGCRTSKLLPGKGGAIAFCGVALKGSNSVGIVWMTDPNRPPDGDQLVFVPRLFNDLSSVVAVRPPPGDVPNAPLAVLGSSVRPPESALLTDTAGRAPVRLFEGTPTDLDIRVDVSASGCRQDRAPADAARFKPALDTAFIHGKALAFHRDTQRELPGDLSAAMSVFHQSGGPEFAGTLDHGKPGNAAIWVGNERRFRSHPLGRLNGKFCLALDNNRAQDVVGVAQDVSAPQDRTAFLWTPHMGLRNLNDFIDPAAGIHLLEARSLSAKGDIAGLALVGGKPRGFMLKRRAANLVIHKVLANGATEVEVGETIQFALTWVYHGLEPAADLVVTDRVPPELDQVAPLTPGGTFIPSSRQVVFTIPGPILPGQAGSVIFNARVSANARGAFTNATYSATTPRSLPASGPPLIVAIRPPPAVPASPLLVFKAALPGSPVSAGDEIAYQIVVFNGGATPVSGITVQDDIPAGSTLLHPPSAGSTVSSNRIVWSLGTLNGGATAALGFQVRVTAQDGEICNTHCIVAAPGFTDVQAPTVCTPVVTRPLDPPVIAFPRDCLIVATGLPTFAEVAVADASALARIDLLVDGAVAGSAVAPPYQIDFSSGPPGRRCVVARAVARDGRTRDSAPVCISVIARPAGLPRYTLTVVTNTVDFEARLNDCGEFTIRPGGDQTLLTQLFAADGSRPLLRDAEAGLSRPVFVLAKRLNNRAQWLADIPNAPHRGVLWDPARGQVLTDFPPIPGCTQVQIVGMNNRGLVVGSSSTGAGLQTGTLWRSGVPERLLPDRVRQGEGVNDAGVIVAAEGRLIQAGAVVETAPRISFFADINERASSAGKDFGTPGFPGIVWHRPNRFEVIPPPTATNRCIPEAINNHHMVVGTMDEIDGRGFTSSETQRGFVSLDGRVADLNTLVNALPSTRRIRGASDINDAGQIIVTGFEFGVGGFTAVLAPVP